MDPAKRLRDGSPWPCAEMRARRCESMHGLPGRRRERRLQHPRNPSRCQRATVAGWTSTSASLHRGHNRRKPSQSRRSHERKRRSERASTPGWWRRDAWTGPTGAPRPSGRRHASPAEWPAAARTSTMFCPDAILARECVQLRLACSVGDSPTGGKVRNLRSLGRIRGGNEADEADRQSHLRDGKRVTGRNASEPSGGLDKK